MGFTKKQCREQKKRQFDWRVHTRKKVERNSKKNQVGQSEVAKAPDGEQRLPER